MKTVEVQFAAISDRGRKRPTNEDSFGYAAEHGIFVVCDGMGGAAAGEIASSMAVEETLRQLSSRRSPLPQALLEAVEAANAAIYARAGQNSKLSGMGTTLVGLAVEAARAWVFNVGDSRCYRLRGDRLEQITLDHSLVEEQVRQGRMTAEEAAHSPLRNIITRVLGSHTRVEPDIFELTAEVGDLFLLCSDGLTHELDDAAIANCLSGGFGLEELCARLVHDAIQAGGHDNITCILVRAEAGPTA